MDPADDVAQLLRRAGRWHGVVTHVEVEVEVGVLDPVRQVEPEWYLDEPATERDEQPEPFARRGRGSPSKNPSPPSPLTSNRLSEET